MALADIRTALKAILEGISGIGRVHDYERWTPEWKGVLDLYRDPTSGTLRAWTITRGATPEDLLTVGGTSGQNLRRHEMVIRGYWALDDSAATEKTFQGTVEAICVELRKDPATTALGTSVLGSSGPPTVRVVGHVLLGDALCHYAEIGYTAVELVTR